MNAHSKTADPHQRVALFVTCMVDTLYPEIGLATVKLLRQYGVDVVFPKDQTCCGQPAFNAGYRAEAGDMARHFLNVFAPLIERGDIDAVVAPSGSCVAMVKHFYDVLFAGANDERDRERAKRVSEVTYELTQYLVDVLGVQATGARCSKALAYHPCCHLLRELQVDAQPRQLIGNLVDAEILELPDASECCGFGGLFAVKNPELSTAMGRRKVANFARSGADALVMNDVSCLTHLNGLLEREGHDCRAVHIAQILTEPGEV
jgi:L-lactate dehydrogenase complex protein LldE